MSTPDAAQGWRQRRMVKPSPRDRGVSAEGVVMSHTVVPHSVVPRAVMSGSLILRALFAPLLCALAFAASAQNAAPETAAQIDASDAQVARERRLPNRHCLRQTGSRITASVNRRADTRVDSKGDAQRCAPVPGRAYDRDDLNRTGETNLADALRRLDPAVN